MADAAQLAVTGTFARIELLHMRKWCGGDALSVARTVGRPCLPVATCGACVPPDRRSSIVEVRIFSPLELRNTFLMSLRPWGRLGAVWRGSGGAGERPGPFPDPIVRRTA